MTNRIFGTGAIKKLEYLEGENFYYAVPFHQHDNELTICVSSQIGCPMHCTFCATGNNKKLIRNLNSQEISEQITESFESMLDYSTMNKLHGLKFLAEGMGDASFNVDNVVNGFKHARGKLLGNHGIKYVNFGVSTIGNTLMIPKYLDFARKDKEKNTKYDFQISLHSANDEHRKLIIPNMPKDKATGRELILEEIVDEFGVLARELHQPMKFNYMLLNQGEWENYSVPRIAELVKLCEYVKNKNLKVKVKLTEYSDTGKGFFSPDPHVYDQVRRTLISNGIEAEYVPLVGQSIRGACGQLNYRKEE